MVVAYIASFVQKVVTGLGSSTSYRYFAGVVLFCALVAIYSSYYLHSKVTELEKGQLLLLGAAVQAKKKAQQKLKMLKSSHNNKSKRRMSKPAGAATPVPMQALKVCSGTNAAKGHPYLRSSTENNERTMPRTLQPISSGNEANTLQLKPVTMSNQDRKSELMAMQALMNGENVCVS